jgi:hypothetical protein
MDEDSDSDLLLAFLTVSRKDFLSVDATVGIADLLLGARTRSSFSRSSLITSAQPYFFPD